MCFSNNKRFFNVFACWGAKMIKKVQKTIKFNVILRDFVNFLKGIQEDMPIPRETKNVYFIVNFSNCNIELSYSADEKLFKFFDYGFYMPLDAQFFWSHELNSVSHQLFDKHSISKKVVMFFLNKIVFEAKNKCKFLNKYRAFFGERFKRVNV